MSKKFIDNVDGVTIPSLSVYEVDFSKLWADAGRTMSGDFSGTFAGTYPKLKLEWPPILEAQQKLLLQLFDKPYVNVKWWDTRTMSFKTGRFYPNDITSGIMFDNGKIRVYKDFKVNLIAVSKM